MCTFSKGVPFEISVALKRQTFPIVSLFYRLCVEQILNFLERDDNREGQKLP